MFRRKQDEETSYWLSYSDMMAGLLLCFVLIISLTMLHAKVQYDEKETQLAGKEEELNAQSVELVNQEKKLSLQSDELEKTIEEQKAIVEDFDTLLSGAKADASKYRQEIQEQNAQEMGDAMQGIKDDIEQGYEDLDKQIEE